ncbi:hypothetical protein WNY51_00235 [Pseudocolwellia sp. AS88]|nr:hypothetical protein [Pseudocolwellia sp. AS88]MDO7084767.1 hypothetical protein [Pseudocolwellia sp. AS88]
MERLPKTPEDVIEHWTLLGQKLTEEMTELQIMQFLLGDLDIELKEKNQK